MALESVQAVASLVQNNSIPAEFIRSESEQPAKTTYKDAVAEIPTIDISDADEDKVVRLMSDASREWGIFQIINHGIPDDVIAKLQSVGKEFFELPHDEKMKCGKEPGSNSYEGYGTKLQKEVEGRKSWVDHLFHIVWPPSAINFRFWPSNPPAYREANEEYAKYMREVVEKLFGGLSKGLGLEPHKLKEGAGGDEAVFMMKINYYPPCPRPDLTLGVVAHTDLSALTILVPNQVPGLQVFKDERWVDVKYIPNALIVHIGDQIQILSNGKYKAVLHRTTVDQERTRMSWPVFIEPPGDFVVGPLPELVDPQNPPQFKSKKFKDYSYCKLNKIPQ